MLFPHIKTPSLFGPAKNKKAHHLINPAMRPFYTHSMSNASSSQSSRQFLCYLLKRIVIKSASPGFSLKKGWHHFAPEELSIWNTLITAMMDMGSTVNRNTTTVVS